MTLPARFLPLMMLFLLSASPALAGDADWQLDIMPAKDVKPGMKGIGKTVFAGETVESFGVEVLDVVKGFYPQQDLFIVRLLGEQAERNGVVSGMSGSPVYLEGKLAGALAMRFGDFQKEAIAGVMPIEAMMRASGYEHQRTPAPAAPKRMGANYLRAVLIGTADALWQQVLATAVPVSAHLSPARQIETPLVLGGFSSQAIAALQPFLSDLGWVPVAGGGSAASGEAVSATLMPGEAVSQVFISGDLSMEMIGTVTAVDRNKVLAFGHSLFNIGPTRMPMARTHILATIPSLIGSSKLGKSVGIVGTFRQDRLSGIYGELGEMPVWIPVEIGLKTPGGEKEFQLRMASDPAFNNLMPFFLRSALYQALVTGKMGADPSTVRLQYEMRLGDGDTLRIKDFISYEERLGFMGAGSEVAEAADLVAMSTGAVLVNDFKTPEILSLRVLAEIVPGESLARIQEIRQDHLKVQPGDSLQLLFTLRRSDGEEIEIRQDVHVPHYLQARRLTVIAGGAAALTMQEMQSNPDKYRPRSFAQLRHILNNRRQADALYIQIREAAPGIAVLGEEMASLPPSILGVMSGKGSERSLHERVLREWSIPTPCEVVGIKRITVRIAQPLKPNRAANRSVPVTPISEW